MFRVLWEAVADGGPLMVPLLVVSSSAAFAQVGVVVLQAMRQKDGEPKRFGWGPEFLSLAAFSAPLPLLAVHYRLVLSRLLDAIHGDPGKAAFGLVAAISHQFNGSLAVLIHYPVAILLGTTGLVLGLRVRFVRASPGVRNGLMLLSGLGGIALLIITFSFINYYLGLIAAFRSIAMAPPDAKSDLLLQAMNIAARSLIPGLLVGASMLLLAITVGFFVAAQHRGRSSSGIRGPRIFALASALLGVGLFVEAVPFAAENHLEKLPASPLGITLPNWVQTPELSGSAKARRNPQVAIGRARVEIEGANAAVNFDRMASELLKVSEMMNADRAGHAEFALIVDRKVPGDRLLAYLQRLHWVGIKRVQFLLGREQIHERPLLGRLNSFSVSALDLRFAASGATCPVEILASETFEDFAGRLQVVGEPTCLKFGDRPPPVVAP